MSDFPSEEIKSRLDIHDVLSGYIRLSKQGASYRALCPFHNEKTASFYVSIPKQIWHCFGCGEGGDIFTFVMKMEGVEFVEALRILAKKAGVTLKSQDPKLANERTALQDLCAQATRFFRNNIESTAGEEAMAYLKQRGLKDETIEEFQIGYAAAAWDSLYSYLAMKGYKADMMEKAGLVLLSEKSGTKKYYDRFRDRIMFPIWDVNGTVVAFTGRYIKPRENEGKYVNSPQTLLYNKSAILYGLDKAKTEIRKADSVVLMEGQMDVIMAHQDGVKNAVAVSGTAFTPLQLRLVKRYTPNITLLFDADAAGDSATQKSIALAQQSGFNLLVARLPDGKDSADFVVAHTGELAGHIAKAVSIMDYYFSSTFGKYDAKDVEGKKEIGRVLLSQIKKIPNQIEAHHWLEQLSTKLGTSMAYLETEMRTMKDEQQFLPEYDDAAKEQEKPKAKKTQLDKLLEHLMALMYAVRDKKTLKIIFEKFGDFELFSGLAADQMAAREMAGAPTLKIFDLFMKYSRIGKQETDIEPALNEQEKSIFAEITLVAEMAEYPDIGKEIVFCASRIERELVDDAMRQLEAALRQAEAERDAKLSEHLFSEVSALSAKKNKLLTYFQATHEEKTKGEKTA